MLSYFLKCQKKEKHTDNINPKVSKTNNFETILLWKYVICDSKKSRVIK